MASFEMRKIGEVATSCATAAGNQSAIDDQRAGRGGSNGSAEDDDSSFGAVANRDLFVEKVRESNEAIQRLDFAAAVRLYTDAIELDPVNHILYSNRSAAYVKLERYDDALKDALKAKQLDPTWTKAYYREGIALQFLDRHIDALVAFANGLALDPRNGQLLNGIVDTALRSPLKGRFQPTYQQLQSMKLDRSPFVIVSVIGQDLLASSYYSASVAVLESALRVGTCSLKLRGSVFSALSSAHWLLKNADQAIAYMQQDLSVAKSLGDQLGECRVHGNLGSAYFTRGDYRESLTHHRCQLRLAMRLKLRDAAASALSSLGHVYSAVGDYPNALASHKQCVLLVKQSGDRALEAREIGAVGAVYTAMGDVDNALVCHEEHLRMARAARDRLEEARALSNLGSAHHCRRDYTRALELHGEVLRLARDAGDVTLEARAHAGLGHAARAAGDVDAAKKHHEHQLDCALRARDRAAEARAIANLGIVYQQLGEHEAALKLHAQHLNLATKLGDRAAQGRAYGNIGIAHSALGRHEAAIKYHKQELAISKEVHDRHSEASTHGNLAVAYQALGMWEQALQHYSAHLNIARDLKDIAGEARALSNIGHYYSVRGEFTQAVPFYQQQLQLSQELQDARGEASACHCLGFAHHALGAHREAVLYYDQYLALARELGDRWHEARAQCNLGLAHVSLGQYARALDCQYGYLQAAHELRSVPNKFRAMGNIGDILVKMGSVQEALILYGQQLKLAKQIEDRSFEASAFGSLGIAHRALKQYETALTYHAHELDIRRQLGDVGGQCRAYGSYGDTYMAAADYDSAFASYEHQLEQAHIARDVAAEARACGNMAIARINAGRHEEAIGHLEHELATLEQLGSGGSAGLAAAIGTGSMARLAQPMPPARLLLEKGRAYGNLGDCYLALRDADEAVRCYEQHLMAAQSAGSLGDQDRSYRGLAEAHRSVGNLQQALVCCEKRLVVAHEMDSNASKAAAYGELGSLHSLLGNFDQAISCLEHQITLAKEQGDKTAEASACCGLGMVYQQMGECHRAVDYHRRDLALAAAAGDVAAQCRAYGNLGLAYESLGELNEALSHQEQHLSLAAQTGDMMAKTLAYSSLGRVHHALGRHSDAVQYLRQGLQIADTLGSREDEAKIRHRLGLALWAHGSLDEAHAQLCRAAELFESIRRDAQIASDYKLSLFDLQTASYQALQRVLVALGRHEEALLMAERGRTRAFVDLLLERQAGSGGGGTGSSGGNGDYSVASASDGVPVTIEQIRSAVDKTRAAVIYYSIAAGQLYSWLLLPEKGLVKFHECSMNEAEFLGGSLADGGASCGAEDSQSLNASVLSALDQCLGHARESLGVDCHLPSSESTSRSSLRKKHSNSSCSSSVAGAGDGGSGAAATVLPSYDVDSESDDPWLLQRNQQQQKQMPMDDITALDNGSRSGRLGRSGDSDRHGFLRMVARNQPLNSSSYSLSSLFSLSNSLAGGAAAGGRRFAAATSRQSSVGSAAAAMAAWNSRAPLSALYSLLIAPLEEHLPRRAAFTAAGSSAGAAVVASPSAAVGTSSVTSPLPGLVLILQGDLYLVPFALLKADTGSGSDVVADGRYLFERFAVLVAPSLSSLSSRPPFGSGGGAGGGACSSDGGGSGSRFGLSGALVVGNPTLPPSVRDLWHLSDLPSAEQEARLVGDLLGARPCIGAAATREAILRDLPSAEVVHLAAHVSWKLSSVILSPSEAMRSTQFGDRLLGVGSKNHDDEDDDDMGSGGEASVDDSMASTVLDSPSLGEFLLTAADILNVRLHARLVVLSSGHTDDRAARINSDGVIGLTRALLAAGARCVLFSLWPVTADASKAFMKMFYVALLQGRPASQALSEAMKKVQSSKQFSHPSNWAGWVLVGNDVKLSSKTALMGQALCEILQSTSGCREAFRVLLHLVEKSLQRIQSGEEKGMYTTVESIESKIGANVSGWKELLTAVGFSFESSAAASGEDGGSAAAATATATPAVFFPLSDPGDRLSQCGVSLQALLALPRGSLAPLARLLRNHEAGEAIIVMLKDLLSRSDSSNQLRMRVKLWRVDGCHELLASLGFDLLDVGKDEVTLKMGKAASRRLLQLAAQALAILFSSQSSSGGSRRSAGVAGLSSSSSMESLNSSHSGSNTTTTSNVSKGSSTPHDGGSTPPMSPMQAKYAIGATRLTIGADELLSSPRDTNSDYASNISNCSSSGSVKTLKAKSIPAIRSGRSPRSATADERMRRKPDLGSSQTTIAESDDTPTDETGSVSSAELSTRTLVPFGSRLPPQGRDAENHSTPSSHSENEESSLPSQKASRARGLLPPTALVLPPRHGGERPRPAAVTRPNREAAVLPPPPSEAAGLLPPQRGPVPRARNSSASSNGNVYGNPPPAGQLGGRAAAGATLATKAVATVATSDRSPSITPAVARDVAELARKVMADTQAECLAVMELQRASVLTGRQSGRIGAPRESLPFAALRQQADVALSDGDEGVSVDGEPMAPSTAVKRLQPDDAEMPSTSQLNGHRVDQNLPAPQPSSLPPARPPVAPKPRARTAASGANKQRPHQSDARPAIALAALPAASRLKQLAWAFDSEDDATGSDVSVSSDQWSANGAFRGSSALVEKTVPRISGPYGVHNTAFAGDDDLGDAPLGESCDDDDGHEAFGIREAADGDVVVGGSPRRPIKSRRSPQAGNEPPPSCVASNSAAAAAVDRRVESARQSVFVNASFIHDDVPVGETIVFGGQAVDRCVATSSVGGGARVINGGVRFDDDEDPSHAVVTGASSTSSHTDSRQREPSAGSAPCDDQISALKMNPVRTGSGNWPSASAAVQLPVIFYMAPGLKSSEC